jgi:hypothetical protein
MHSKPVIQVSHSHMRSKPSVLSNFRYPSKGTANTEPKSPIGLQNSMETQKKKSKKQENDYEDKRKAVVLLTVPPRPPRRIPLNRCPSVIPLFSPITPLSFDSLFSRLLPPLCFSTDYSSFNGSLSLPVCATCRA